MGDYDARFDEDRGGPEHPDNLISLAKDGRVHRATRKVWPWRPCGAHDQGRAVVPSIFVEALFRKAPVDRSKLGPRPRVLTHCLGVKEYLGEALEKLVDCGLTSEPGVEGEDDEVEITFSSPTDLYKKADRLVGELQDDPVITVTEASCEWLHGFDGTAAEQDIAWFAEYTWADACARLGNLEVYITLAFMMGPRMTAAIRIDTSSTCHAMIGAGAGGQLLSAVRAFYYSDQASAPASLDFLRGRLSDFIVDSRWPVPYRVDYPVWLEYAYDLPKRVKWKSASRQEWAFLVQNKIQRTIAELPTLNELFMDYIPNEQKLIRETQSLGDLLLPGEQSEKYPFLNIEEVESILTRDFGELVISEREEGSDTLAILTKIRKRLKATREEVSGGDGDATAETRGPKPGQITRALVAEPYARVEVKHLGTMQNSPSVDDKLVVLGEVLTSGSVLPHAVLFASAGQRISGYLGHAGTDFLALLHAERHLMTLLFGQTLVYSEAEGCVPDIFRHYRDPIEETEKTLNFEWTKFDPLNNVILRIRATEAGTVFSKHDPKNVYHDCEMLREIKEYNARRFECIGYARMVKKGEGVSHRQFMDKILTIAKYATGLPPGEQAGAWLLLDDYVERGTQWAQDNGKRTVYGPNPADRVLYAWISQEAEVLDDLEETLEGISMHALHRKRLGSILGAKPRAAPLPGYKALTFTSGSTGTSSVQPASSSRKRQKNAKGKSNAGAGGVAASGAVIAGAGAGGGNSASGAPAAMGSKSSGKKKANHEDAKAGKQSRTAAGKGHIFLYADGSFSIGAHNADSNPLPSQRRERARACCTTIRPCRVNRGPDHRTHMALAAVECWP